MYLQTLIFITFSVFYIQSSPIVQNDVMPIGYQQRNVNFVPEEEKTAHYTLSRGNADSLTLRYQSYLYGIEIFYTLEKKREEVYTLMRALGVAEASITTLKTDMAAQQTALTETAIEEMDTAFKIAKKLGETNNNVVLAPDQLNTDLIFVTGQSVNLNVTHASVRARTNAYSQLFRFRVENLIRLKIGPQKAEIAILLDNMDAGFDVKLNTLDLCKNALDVSLKLSQAAVDILIAQIP